VGSINRRLAQDIERRSYLKNSLESRRSGGMVLEVEHLQSQHKTLSSNHRAAEKKKMLGILGMLSRQ
jgi:hypothetical protein